MIHAIRMHRRNVLGAFSGGSGFLAVYVGYRVFRLEPLFQRLALGGLGSGGAGREQSDTEEGGESFNGFHGVVWDTVGRSDASIITIIE